VVIVAGRVGLHHWAEASGEHADVQAVVHSLRDRLRGLRAVNVSWDSGKMHELNGTPPGWTLHGQHAVSPVLDDAELESWPQSQCKDGMYDEWYFFRVLPAELALQPLCNWYGIGLQRAAELAFPGGFDLAAQLEAAMPEIVIGEGTNLFVIALDESVCSALGQVACAP
jgi:hypothetical protein